MKVTQCWIGTVLEQLRCNIRTTQLDCAMKTRVQCTVHRCIKQRFEGMTTQFPQRCVELRSSITPHKIYEQPFLKEHVEDVLCYLPVICMEEKLGR